uniref:Hexosyltransferase n=1 Tax=Arion vulgaris TaxID=1028688 RepID=A0A0B7BLK7_9EUPU
MSLPSWCSNPSKYTVLKATLLILFIIVNVFLYTQSKYAIFMDILPRIGINFSVAVVTNTVNGSSSSSSFTYVPQYNIFNNFTNVPATTNSQTTQALIVPKIKFENPFTNENVVNPHSFRYIITPNVTCTDRDVELVICVPISQDNYKGRTVIRNTWGSYAYNVTNKAILIFFIGSNLNPEQVTTDKQLSESAQYGDILQEDYIDCYNNLSLKSVSILKWVSSFCSNAKFVLKADDDMYVNIPFMITTLRKYITDAPTKDAFIVGSVQNNAHPIRSSSSKWYTPFKLYPDSTYPKYVSGTAYAMTVKAAFLLYEASLRVPIFWLEDVYITGLCARKGKVDVNHSGYFSYGKPGASGCSFRQHISGHRYSHQEILNIHKELYDVNLQC